MTFFVLYATITIIDYYYNQNTYFNKMKESAILKLNHEMELDRLRTNCSKIYESNLTFILYNIDYDISKLKKNKLSNDLYKMFQGFLIKFVIISIIDIILLFNNKIFT
jgi:hypothetical protein